MAPFSILFVFHYTINLHKQGMDFVFFLVTDRLEKMHMLNQMGETNSFIKRVLNLPVYSITGDNMALILCYS